MRVAIAGIKHWHAHYYYRTASNTPGVTVVAVADRDMSLCSRIAADLSALAFADLREMVARTKPDLVCLLGQHNEVSSQALWLIEQGVPFIIDKPGGMNYFDVARIRDQAAAKNHRIDVSFVYRVSDFWKHLSRLIEDDPVTWMSFRLIGGGPNRYRESGNAWMLDPAQSGGGSTINLSVHFFDLFRLLTRSAATEVTSLMGNHTWGLPIEDYSSVIMRSPVSVCTVETGYTYPGPAGAWDLRFSICTKSAYAVLRGDSVLEIYRKAGEPPAHIQTAAAGLSHWFPVFVREALTRFMRGEAPVADATDLANAMAVVDAAYSSNRLGGVPVKL